MAYIGRGSPLSYLQYATSAVSNIATFTATNTSTALTVSFHLVNTATNTFSSSPTAHLCNGKSYVLAVNSSGTQSGAKMLQTPVPLGTINYTLVDPPTSLSTAGLTIFIPTSNLITLSAPFPATMDGSPDTYVLTPSPNFSSVGYTTALTNPLTNCASCGCGTGSTCQSNGVCSSLCAAGAACGGACNGTCPTGYTCSLGTNGTYSCTSVWNTWWMWIIAGIVLFVFIVFIGLFAVSTTPQPKKVQMVGGKQVEKVIIAEKTNPLQTTNYPQTPYSTVSSNSPPTYQ